VKGGSLRDRPESDEAQDHARRAQGFAGSAQDNQVGQALLELAKAIEELAKGVQTPK
jgi:hypothetical protein